MDDSEKLKSLAKSSHYPSGFALRFARITGIREDKRVLNADTLSFLRSLFEKQFKRKSLGI